MHYNWGARGRLNALKWLQLNNRALPVAFHHYIRCKLLRLLKNRYTCSKPAKELFLQLSVSIQYRWWRTQDKDIAHLSVMPSDLFSALRSWLNHILSSSFRYWPILQHMACAGLSEAWLQTQRYQAQTSHPSVLAVMTRWSKSLDLSLVWLCVFYSCPQLLRNP